MPYRYSATDRYASDAPITDSSSDVTEYRKKPNSDIEYRKLKNAQNHLYSLPVSENIEYRKKTESIRMYSKLSNANILVIWHPIDFGFRAIDCKFIDAPISDASEYE